MDECDHRDAVWSGVVWKCPTTYCGPWGRYTFEIMTGRVPDADDSGSRS